MRRLSPNVRRTKPKMPCTQPMAANRNRAMNNTSNTVREVDQPVRQSRSANSIETKPVSDTAHE